jgi:hypothetical protein
MIGLRRAVRALILAGDRLEAAGGTTIPARIPCG